MKASVFASHLDDEVLGVGGANINHLEAKDIYVFVVIEGSSTEWETQAQNRFIPNVNLEITNQLKKSRRRSPIINSIYVPTPLPPGGILSVWKLLNLLCL